MNVHAIDTARIRHITVQGNLQFQSDRDDLFNELKPGNYVELEVTFFDARILPADVIARLMASIAANPRIKFKINVFHRYLASYLFRLGIRCHSLNQHAFELRESKRIRAIAIGGSAGSLDKIMSVMGKLPPNEISVFIVQHILENEPNYLGEILQRSTKLKTGRMVSSVQYARYRLY